MGLGTETFLLAYPLRYITEWVMMGRMDAVLHALADPHRRVIVEALTTGEATAGELGALVPVSQPGVSRHLSVLRSALHTEVARGTRQRKGKP